MTTVSTGAQVRQIAAGFFVARATATIPATGSQNIFTVSNGNILLTSFVGVVTTAIGGTATNLKLTYTPTTGSASDIAANVAITSKPAGTMLTLNATLGSALVAGATGSYATAGLQWVALAPGTMSITTDATTTGSIKWQYTYIPLETGATSTFA